MVGGENERGRGEQRGREGAMKQVQGAGGLGLFVTSDGSLADADGITESSSMTQLKRLEVAGPEDVVSVFLSSSISQLRFPPC